MKRQLATVLVAAATAAMFLATAPAAVATSAQPAQPIRTFHEALNFNLVGTGAQARWYSHIKGTEEVALSPRLAF
jgi:hypothetical protein